MSTKQSRRLWRQLGVGKRIVSCVCEPLLALAEEERQTFANARIAALMDRVLGDFGDRSD